MTIAADTVTDAIWKVATCLATRGRNLVFPDQPIDVAAQRDANLFARRYGVDGEEGTTLTALGTPLGITRERMRQIVQKSIERSAQFEFDIPVLDALDLACASCLPCPVSVLNNHTRTLLGELLIFEHACLFAGDLLGRRIARMSESVMRPGSLRIDSWACAPDDDDIAEVEDVKGV
ncbi:hypothetical protein [Paraburkholderia sp. BL6665CI2N2]|uniref:hypothetical protein n=1 Tax=Paraburkholderia sp. BL6665CI2N2 TaxID=1938806 RepID=UPI001064C2C5|nr:hypothetical protein [Paraburkholderia sp. BL6665CI2N2]